MNDDAWKPRLPVPVPGPGEQLVVVSGPNGSERHLVGPALRCPWCGQEAWMETVEVVVRGHPLASDEALEAAVLHAADGAPLEARVTWCLWCEWTTSPG